MGLEELQRVLPGGDTFMHEGIQRVRRHSPIGLRYEHCLLSQGLLVENRPLSLPLTARKHGNYSSNFSSFNRPVSRYTMGILKVRSPVL